MSTKIGLPATVGEVSDPSDKFQCFYCHRTPFEGVLHPAGALKNHGICRVCCTLFSAAWATCDAERERVRASGKVQRAAVLLARRRVAPGRHGGKGVVLPPELVSSYDFALVNGNLPAAVVIGDDDDATSAALGVLLQCGYRSWEQSLSLLYMGRDSDGIMMAVYTPTLVGLQYGYVGNGLDVNWAAWPLIDCMEPGLGKVLDGLFRQFLVDRLSKGAPEPCQMLNEATVRYADLMLRWRDDPSVDVSMAKVYQQAAGEDQIAAVEGLLKKVAESEGEQEVEQDDSG